MLVSPGEGRASEEQGLREPGPWLACRGRADDHHKHPQLIRAPPSLQDTEIINTAILTGRTVAIPVKVIAIEVTGLVLDVSALVECESDNEDIIKVGVLEMGPPRASDLQGEWSPKPVGIHIPGSSLGRQVEEKWGWGRIASHPTSSLRGVRKSPGDCYPRGLPAGI